MQGSQLNNLNKLTALNDILPVIKLTKIQDRISGLNTCYSLTVQDMESKYICPHCKFNLSEGSRPVFGVLDFVQNDIDTLYKEWTEIIINSIEDPMVSGNIPYLKPEQQKEINRLLNTRKLPDNIDRNFISGVNTLMQGLEKIEVSIEDVKKSIFGDGPAGVDDIKKRFEKYISELTKGKDENKVRIIIK